MDAILVVNAGSSSLKFQIFGIEEQKILQRLVKGQMDGIGTKPRLRVEGDGDSPRVDQVYPIGAGPGRYRRDPSRSKPGCGRRRASASPLSATASFTADPNTAAPC